MVKIHNFQKDAESIYEVNYGGASCRKHEMFYQDKYWMIKFPSNLRELREKRKNRRVPSYSMSCTNEWLGSHIYESIDIPVHNTILGKYQDKIVVACEHVDHNDEKLWEFRDLLKAWYSDEYYDLMSRHTIELDHVFNMIEKREDLKNLGMKERFWDMFIVDMLIANPDRNMGNWGIIRNRNTREIRLSPVYDNGNCLNAKLDELGVENAFKNWKMFKTSCILNSACPFLDNGKPITPIQFLKKSEDSNCIEAVGRIVPRVDLRTCVDLIQELQSANLINRSQALIHTSGLAIRFNKVLRPVYEMHFGELPRESRSFSPSL